MTSGRGIHRSATCAGSRSTSSRSIARSSRKSPTTPTTPRSARRSFPLGRGLELEVVAEGVETARQARALTVQGCHLMQGYLFSRPVPAAEITPLLQRPPVLSGDVLDSLHSRPTLVR